MTPHKASKFGQGRLLPLAALGWCLLTAGCATIGPAPTPAPAVATKAHLEVVNLTNYEWRIVVTSNSENETHDSRLAARASLKVDLTGGDYVIEQSVLSGGAGPGLTRRVPARLESGQTYRWRLDTLLSNPDQDAAPATETPRP